MYMYNYYDDVSVKSIKHYRWSDQVPEYNCAFACMHGVLYHLMCHRSTDHNVCEIMGQVATCTVHGSPDRLSYQETLSGQLRIMAFSDQPVEVISLKTIDLLLL